MVKQMIVVGGVNWCATRFIRQKMLLGCFAATISPVCERP